MLNKNIYWFFLFIIFNNKFITENFTDNEENYILKENKEEKYNNKEKLMDLVEKIEDKIIDTKKTVIDEAYHLKHTLSNISNPLNNSQKLYKNFFATIIIAAVPSIIFIYCFRKFFKKKSCIPENTEKYNYNFQWLAFIMLIVNVLYIFSSISLSDRIDTFYGLYIKKHNIVNWIFKVFTGIVGTFGIYGLISYYKLSNKMSWLKFFIDNNYIFSMIFLFLMILYWLPVWKNPKPWVNKSISFHKKLTNIMFPQSENGLEYRSMRLFYLGLINVLTTLALSCIWGVFITHHMNKFQLNIKNNKLYLLIKFIDLSLHAIIIIGLLVNIYFYSKTVYNNYINYPKKTINKYNQTDLNRCFMAYFYYLSSKFLLPLMSYLGYLAIINESKKKGN